ncbi:methyltransferase domain-containing protein [Streptomyces sp. NPDC014733]|uniref:methyltransferase domain-containing protein n=1 Tax=Streptomyces sp. NPDC014733 TaxID=3364885 RepID=UPI0036FBC6B0
MSVTDTPRYAPGWLTLREPADAAARATAPLGPLRDLLARRRRKLPPKTPLTVRDLGCGTGSMARWLAPRLPGPQHWILQDHDPRLLALATGSLPPAAADGAPVTAATACADLTRLTAADLAGTDLLTASALLDMLTPGEIDALAAACVAAGCPALLTLSVTGRPAFTSYDPLDADLTAAFNDHQRRTTAGRRLLGPDAAATARAAFARRGASVTTYAADWQLGAGQRELTAAWLRGWVGAAVEQRPELAGAAAGYLRGREAELAAGTLGVTLGHDDLLVLPAGAS